MPLPTAKSDPTQPKSDEVERSLKLSDPDESDEVPFVQPLVNPTPTKPTLDFEVTNVAGRSIRGFFTDESAAIEWHVRIHGPSGAHVPTVVCHTPDRVAKVYGQE